MKKSILLLALLATACASTESGLQQATARAVRGVNPDNVQIVTTDRGLMQTKWTASVHGKRYKCFADDMIRNPTCL